MKIAVIGGGFTGLTAAYELTKKGHAVTLFEREKVLGGLAYGFREPSWQWHLEYAYHHWFTNDRAMLGLIERLGISDKLIVRRPITANLLPQGAEIPPLRRETSAPQIYQLDSPVNLLTFPSLSIIDKLRTAALLAYLKLTPFWHPLENITTEQLLCSIGGKKAYRVLWESLLVGKFSGFAPKVQAAWFWARIKKRTPSLCYLMGGFHTLILALEQAITKNGGKIYTNTTVQSIKQTSAGFDVFYQQNSRIVHCAFDKILLTVPTPAAAQLIQFPISYIKPLLTIPHLTAQTLILETKEPILSAVYWLNITDRSFPFLAAVAHTNFMDKKYYGGHHLTYFGNYLPQGHPYLSMTKEQLLKEFLPYIKKLLPKPSTLNPIRSFLFVGPFAQPVHELHYSSRTPKLETPLSNVYLANMDSIVPWDRGTNYAVELGQKAAKKIMV